MCDFHILTRCEKSNRTSW